MLQVGCVLLCELGMQEEGGFASVRMERTVTRSYKNSDEG